MHQVIIPKAESHHKCDINVKEWEEYKTYIFV